MTLHVESSGQGAPVVLLHGWGLNLRVFDALARELARSHRVIAIDLPGHGRSPLDAQALTFDAQVAAIGARIPEDSAVIGWSLGGQFALALARSHRLRSLALLASTPRFVSDADWTAGMKPLFLRAFASRFAENWAAVLDEFLSLQVRGTRGATGVLAELRSALESHGTPDPAALAHGLSFLRDNDLRTSAREVTVPTLLISGQHDRVTPPAASAWLAATLPDATHVDLPRAGHAPFLSHADETVTLLREFLAT
ncbi:MAG: pimeloyl-ACP methyl ester esterase BioH [Steroidobacteraceae bacterium]